MCGTFALLASYQTRTYVQDPYSSLTSDSPRTAPLHRPQRKSCKFGFLQWDITFLQDPYSSLTSDSPRIALDEIEGSPLLAVHLLARAS